MSFLRPPALSGVPAVLARSGRTTWAVVIRADEEEMFPFGRQRAVPALIACGLALAACGLAPSACGLARLTASGPVLTASGLVLSLFGASNDRQKAYRESAVGRARMETDAILAPHVLPPKADQMDEYVPRLEPEALLEAYLQQPESKAATYFVVYGARGAGKSTLVKHVLSKSGAGIVVVETGDAQGPDLDTLVVDTALKQHRAGQPGMYVPSEALKGQLYERLEQVTQAYREAHPDEPHWRPTVVFDVNKLGDSKLIASVCAHAKQLTHDEGLCHAIVVLSCSFAVAKLPEDPGRQEFLRVGSFSCEEASAVLDATLLALPKEVASDAAVAAVNERVLPLTTLAKFASAFEAAARQNVEDALTLEDMVRNGCAFTVADLMRDLLDAGAPVKLPTAKYKVIAERFAATIRTSRAATATFNVDLISQRVDFASGAHRAAAAEAEAARAKAEAEAEAARAAKAEVEAARAKTVCVDALASYWHVRQA
ncbi:hypothetical protein T492DRAFT_898208 [Pavlovales sp. CCMP2436]|nr:hypothetical protein T492DRAFT_898208 [Pavlovales sp. CCMP2436]